MWKRIRKKLLTAMCSVFWKNDTVIAFIVRGEEFGKRFWGLSKKGLTDGDIDGFRTFLLQKCTGVKKGIEEIKTK